jgi:hypothetical protein
MGVEAVSGAQPSPEVSLTAAGTRRERIHGPYARTAEAVAAATACV